MYLPSCSNGVAFQYPILQDKKEKLFIILNYLYYIIFTLEIASILPPWRVHGVSCDDKNIWSSHREINSQDGSNRTQKFSRAVIKPCQAFSSPVRHYKQPHRMISLTTPLPLFPLCVPSLSYAFH